MLFYDRSCSSKLNASPPADVPWQDRRSAVANTHRIADAMEAGVIRIVAAASRGAGAAGRLGRSSLFKPEEPRRAAAAVMLRENGQAGTAGRWRQPPQISTRIRAPRLDQASPIAPSRGRGSLRIGRPWWRNRARKLRSLLAAEPDGWTGPENKLRRPVVRPWSAGDRVLPTSSWADLPRGRGASRHFAVAGRPPSRKRSHDSLAEAMCGSAALDADDDWPQHTVVSPNSSGRASRGRARRSPIDRRPAAKTLIV